MSVSAKTAPRRTPGKFRRFFRRFHVTPKVYFRLKIACVAAVPLLYFVCSPLLIVPMLVYVALFYLGLGVEREINRNVIRRNRIRLVRIDSVLALIVVVIAIAGTAVSANSKIRPGGFAHMDDETVQELIDDADFSAARRRSAWVGFTQKVADFGSLLTGRRSVFSGMRRFATVDPPENFGPPPGEMPDFGDMPFDYVISSVLSSINTVLVFGTAGAGLLSLLVYRRRKKNAERYVSQVIPDTSMANFTDEQLEKILFYGVTDDDAGEAPPEPAAQDAPPPAVPAVPDASASDGDPPDGAHGSSDDAAGS